MTAAKFPLVLAAACLLGVAATAAAQTKIVREQPKPNFSTSGADNYHQYCAPCHGAAGKGDGPAAPALKVPPTDLTQMTAKHNGKFPERDARDIILGETELAAHGNREMPVWGPIFHNISGENHDVAELRLRNLIEYLKGIQAKP